MPKKPVGRPRKYAEYDQLVRELPKDMKRPKYVKNVGVRKGARSTTAWVRVIFPRHDGKERREEKEIRIGALASWSWKQLEERRDELQGRADRGEPLEDEVADTFATYANRWLEQFQGKDDRTVKSHITKHFVPTFGTTRLDALTRGQINSYVAGRFKQAAMATVKRELETLNSILNDAVRDGLISENPGRFVNKKAFARIKQRDTVLSREDEATLLAKAEEVEDWLSDLIRWAVYSGMRRGEILNMRWSDLKDQGGVTLLNIPETKTNKERDVPCRAILLDILDRQRERKQKGNDHVFPITPQVLRTRWKRALIAASLTEIVGYKKRKRGEPVPIHKATLTIHDLRRTCATRLIEAGVDPLAGYRRTDVTRLVQRAVLRGCLPIDLPLQQIKS
jgi:integrase